jgi:hypothetical protein
MAKEKGRRTPKKTDTGKGDAWMEAVGQGGMNARPNAEHMGSDCSKIVTHRAQVQDKPVSYANGQVVRSY